MSKTIFIGPSQHVELIALSEILNFSPFFDHFERVDSDTIFFTCLIQSGARYFSVRDGQETLKTHSRYLKTRIKHRPANALKEFEFIFRTFDRPTAEKSTDRQAWDAVTQIACFLVDLLYVAKHKISLVCMRRFPSPEEILLAHKVAPQLATAVLLLLSQVQHERVTAPVPRLLLSRTDVRRVEELMKSDLFQQHREAHTALDDASYSRSKTLAQITDTGRRLQRAFSDRSETINLGLGLLTLTSKTIDTVFGKLPGAFADFAVRITEPILQEQRQLVIYDFGNMWRYLVNQRIQQLVDSEGKDQPRLLAAALRERAKSFGGDSPEEAVADLKARESRTTP